MAFSCIRGGCKNCAFYVECPKINNLVFVINGFRIDRLFTNVIIKVCNLFKSDFEMSEFYIK